MSATDSTPWQLATLGALLLALLGMVGAAGRRADRPA
jgi:hypothetical protein